MAGSAAPFREDITASETGLLIAEEQYPGVMPEDGEWREKDPNNYDNFGAKLKLVARSPITSDRQNKKGTIVGLSVAGGFNEDLTMGNLQEDLQGFFFADLRRKSEFPVVSFAADGIVLANGGSAYVPGTILAVRGSRTPNNNGMRIVADVPSSDKIPGVYTPSPQDTNVIVSRVGREFPAGDLSIDVTGPLPQLVSAAVDMTSLGFVPGEIIFVGGDAVASRFPDASQSTGWARILAITTTSLTFDKTDAEWLAGSGAGKSIHLYFGRVLKNEQRDLIKYRTYSLRRLLGRPDLDDPNRIQSEVLSGATPGSIEFKMPEENKISADIMYMARRYKAFSNDAEIGGTIIGTLEEDAVNTAGDTVRTRMAVYPTLGDNSAPKSLFAVFEKFDLKIDNKLEENKGVGRLGSFSISPGNFMVSGKFTAYFVDVASVDAVARSSDVTFDMMAVKDNKGFALDLPLVALGSDGANVEPNKSIRLDLDVQAANGVKYHPDLNHTLLMVFYDYLPTIAGVNS